MSIAESVAAVVDTEAELLELYPALVRRLTMVLRDAEEARDVAQATYARALERRARFRGGDLRAWVYTIGLRLAFNELRRRRRTGESGGDMGVGAADPSTEPTWAMETDPDLWIALTELDPPQRAALLLSAPEGYTHEEIGRMLGVRTGTVSSWLSRTKDRLRAVLGEEQ